MSNKREDTLHNDVTDDVVTLGVASVDTKGGPLSGEEVGGLTPLGIAQD